MTAKGSSITEDITTSALLLVHLYRKLVCQKKGRCYCLSKKGRCYNVCDITTKICLAEKMEVLLSVISHQVVCQKTREVFVISPVHISMSVSKKGGVIVYDITTSARLSEKGRCYCFQYHHISLSVRKREVLLFVISPCQPAVEKGR